MIFLAIATSSAVCFAVVLFPFRPPPPATPAVRGRVLIGGLPYSSVCVSFSCFSSRFPGFIARPRLEVWEWVLRSSIFDSWSSS